MVGCVGVMVTLMWLLFEATKIGFEGQRKFGTSEATTAAFCVTKFPQTLASLPLFLGCVTQERKEQFLFLLLVQYFGTILKNISVLILPDRTPIVV